MKESTRSRTLVVFSCLMVLSLPAVAAAAAQKHAGEHSTTMHVSYADLDLSNKAGLTTLYQRLQSAARKVCGSTHYWQTGSLKLAKLNRQCYQDALDAAVENANMAKLEEIHRG